MQGDYYFCVIMGQGVAGAAIATVIAQYASFLAYPISLFYRKKTYLNNLPGPLECVATPHPPPLSSPRTTTILTTAVMYSRCQQVVRG